MSRMTEYLKEREKLSRIALKSRLKACCVTRLSVYDQSDEFCSNVYVCSSCGTAYQLEDGKLYKVHIDTSFEDGRILNCYKIK